MFAIIILYIDAYAWFVAGTDSRHRTTRSETAW